MQRREDVRHAACRKVGRKGGRGSRARPPLPRIPGGSRFSERRALPEGRWDAPAESDSRRKLPFQGSVQGEGRAGGEWRLRGLHTRGFGSWSDAPDLLAGSQSSLFEDESSGLGKAGAAWGCRPTEHPLPSPAGNPAGSPPLVASCHVRLLGKASVSGTAPRAVPTFSGMNGADYTRSAGQGVSGGSASGSSRRETRLSALGGGQGSRRFSGLRGPETPRSKLPD